MTSERENKARKILVERLRDLFDIKQEVPGKWPLDGRALRLDLLLRPNEKAKALGFDVDAIGVEVKDPQKKASKNYLIVSCRHIPIHFVSLMELRLFKKQSTL